MIYNWTLLPVRYFEDVPTFFSFLAVRSSATAAEHAFCRCGFHEDFICQSGRISGSCAGFVQHIPWRTLVLHYWICKFFFYGPPWFTIVFCKRVPMHLTSLNSASQKNRTTMQVSSPTSSWRMSSWNLMKHQTMVCRNDGTNGIEKFGHMTKPVRFMSCCHTAVAIGEKLWNVRPREKLLWRTWFLLWLVAIMWRYIETNRHSYSRTKKNNLELLDSRLQQPFWLFWRFVHAVLDQLAGGKEHQRFQHQLKQTALNRSMWWTMTRWRFWLPWKRLQADLCFIYGIPKLSGVPDIVRRCYQTTGIHRPAKGGVSVKFSISKNYSNLPWAKPLFLKSWLNKAIRAWEYLGNRCWNLGNGISGNDIADNECWDSGCKPNPQN